MQSETTKSAERATTCGANVRSSRSSGYFQIKRGYCSGSRHTVCHFSTVCKVRGYCIHSSKVITTYTTSETVHKNVVVRAVINNSGKNSLNVLACLAFERTRVRKCKTSSIIAYRALASSASDSFSFSLCWIYRVVRHFSHREYSKTSFQSDLDRAAAHAVYPRFLRLKSPRLKSVQQLTCRLQCQFQNPLRFVRGALSTRP
ncbi:hypothetical protein T03_11310 [Trichinella britovi]|uniref:Uncharacterized protein n=1 Tax=Trichinella britovi TaxID=45882 RepID=A0A0V1C815_TRIBR|nr:hypothetical protein T03_11310 [Trichinella britovi]